MDEPELTTHALTVSIVPRGATWRYSDLGGDQGTAWRAPNFDDSSWASGSAELGYGDGDEATVLSFGPDPANKPITTYFRHTFTVDDPTVYTGLSVGVLRDDGAMVYLNGTEIFRSNMPSGVITYTSLAAGGGEYQFFDTTTVNPALLVPGANVLAIEVHQAGPGSSDISMNAELIGTNIPRVDRGPYLQQGTPTSAVVRFRTNTSFVGRVRYGTSVTALTSTADDEAATAEHVIALSGLTPDTKYFYSIGTTAETLAGGDANHFLVTLPVPGTVKPTRVWALGDSGTADIGASRVRDGFTTFAGSAKADVWLMLGDNAYSAGYDIDYQRAVFDMYPTILRNTFLWTVIGNHDTAFSENPPADLPYFQMFSLPTQGQAGGVPSGTEQYYSFDVADTHFVVLDSMTSLRTPNSPMLNWLSNDLAASTRKWTIAAFHHPPYSKGSHDSDLDIELVQMRENALPILENHGVDLVLTGHSHSYERSILLDGVYDTPSTVGPANRKDPKSGREDGTGPYVKALGGRQGAVYIVAGSSGKISDPPTPLNHPAMFVSLNQLGSVVLDIEANRIVAKFLREQGASPAVADWFTLVKPIPNVPPTVSLTAPADNATFVAPATVALTANAADPDGTVARVDFFNGSTLLGSDTAAPWEYTWPGVAPGTYALTAVAVDSAAASTTSAAITITVNPNVPPTVSLTAPANNTTYVAPATVALAATAMDVDGTVARVDFYEGTTLLASDTTAPWGYAWSGVMPGTYSLTAVAVDSAGASTTSGTVTITVNANVPPTVALTAPANNATYFAPATVALAATAMDVDGLITRVDFYVGTTLLGSVAAAPWEYTWPGVAAGTYTLTAVAIDSAGASTTSGAVAIAVRDNMPPTVALTAPANNATYVAPATVSIAADASDPDGTVARVDFYNGPTLLGSDTTAPWEYAWGGVAAGTFSLTAVSVDLLGSSTTSLPIMITVNNNVPPTVSLTAPVNNATYVAPATVVLAANAADADGTVARVEFYNGTTLLGTDATSPWGFTWTGVGAGTYRLTALAVDSRGDSTVSAAITVTVNAPAPTTLIAKKATSWRYYPGASVPPANSSTTWKGRTYSDSAWASGAAQLGYGDGDEATVIPCCASGNTTKYITTYFRKSFTVTNPADYPSLLVELLRDDGAVVYLNGTEIFRSNMPSGSITNSTRSSNSVTGSSENTYYTKTVTNASSLLVAGTNVIAVELHQYNNTTPDASFDLALRKP